MNEKVNLLTKLSIAIAFIYGIYLIKTAVGVNLSSRYSAPRIFKLPFIAVDYPLGSHNINLKSRIKRIRHYL